MWQTKPGIQRGRLLHARKNLLGHVGERFADIPHARQIARMDVREQAHDAAPAHRPRGEGIDMQPCVVLGRGIFAARDLDGAIGGSRAFELRRIVGEQSAHQRHRA